jgi:hypothetical protein
MPVLILPHRKGCPDRFSGRVDRRLLFTQIRVGEPQSGSAPGKAFRQQVRSLAGSLAAHSGNERQQKTNLPAVLVPGSLRWWVPCPQRNRPLSERLPGQLYPDSPGDGFEIVEETRPTGAGKEVAGRAPEFSGFYSFIAQPSDRLEDVEAF